MNVHAYSARLVWEGTQERGRPSLDYRRDYRLVVAGKPELPGSASSAFRGDSTRHDPEDLMLAAVAACHMLFYLGLCARQGVCVLSYEDEAGGTLRLEPDGGGRFTEILLRPVVTIDRAEDIALATRLHDVAHERCFIANSCSTPIRHAATIRAAAAAASCGAAFPLPGAR